MPFGETGPHRAVQGGRARGGEGTDCARPAACISSSIATRLEAGGAPGFLGALAGVQRVELGTRLSDAHAPWTGRNQILLRPPPQGARPFRAPILGVAGHLDATSTTVALPMFTVVPSTADMDVMPLVMCTTQSTADPQKGGLIKRGWQARRAGGGAPGPCHPRFGPLSNATPRLVQRGIRGSDRAVRNGGRTSFHHTAALAQTSCDGDAACNHLGVLHAHGDGAAQDNGKAVAFTSATAAGSRPHAHIFDNAAIRA
jgi:hypothetical protein